MKPESQISHVAGFDVEPIPAIMAQKNEPCQTVSVPCGKPRPGIDVDSDESRIRPVNLVRFDVVNSTLPLAEDVGHLFTDFGHSRPTRGLQIGPGK